MAEAEKRSVLLDYYRPGGVRKVTVLSDFSGAEESATLAYKVGNKIIQANNDLIGSITGLPSQFKDNWALLRDPTQRRLLGRAFIDDSVLTHRRRKAIFSILLWSTIILWLAVGLIIRAVNQDALGAYQSVYSLFFYSIATSLMLPTPFEILLKDAVGSLGIAWTVLVAALGKTVGSWLVLMAGDKANEGLEVLLEKRKTLRKMFHALERFAQKFGYFAIFIMFAIPFNSDTIPLFVLAVMKMNKMWFLITTFVAIVVRSLIFIWVFA